MNKNLPGNMVDTIDVEQFASYVDPNTQKIVKILKDHHVPARIVGGAVRDVLLDKTPRDIDLVVDNEPSETLFLLDLYDIPVDTSGILHGTIKAVFGYGKSKEKVEITSIGYRMSLVNKRPVVTQSHNWATDSSMRDLSINSLSMDLHGHVWDYQDGYKDLRESRVRMLPYIKENIESDANWIMRWFKAMTIFDNPRLVKSDIDFVQKHLHLVEQVADDERTSRNLLTIQKSANGAKILALMCEMGLKKYLPILPCS